MSPPALADLSQMTWPEAVLVGLAALPVWYPALKDNK